MGEEQGKEEQLNNICCMVGKQGGRALDCRWTSSYMELAMGTRHACIFHGGNTKCMQQNPVESEVVTRGATDFGLYQSFESWIGSFHR